MNVVLLTIDSLRADYAAPDAGLMPTLAEYAGDGVSFSRVYSNGYATPVSFPTFLTGTYATRYGGWRYMADERPFLAAKFDDVGYETAAIHSNPHLRADKNYDTGFDFYNEFKDDAGLLSQLRYLVTENVDPSSRLYRYLRRVYHVFRSSSGSADYVKAPDINARAFEWLDSYWNGEDRFFLWAHYMDPHYPFYPPTEFREERAKDISTSRAVTLNGKMQENSEELTEQEREELRMLYRGDVRYTDDHFKRLVEGLRDRGVYEDTVFVVTSDHGELFGEHGRFGHPPTASNEILHVPLVLFGPGLPEGVDVDATRSLVDLPPTLADICNLETDPKWDGKSLTPTFDGNGQDRSFIVGDEDMLAYQQSGWRLSWWREVENPRNPDQKWELWNVKEGELISLSEQPNVVKEFKTHLQKYVEEAKQGERLTEPDVDVETANQLDALGYK